MLSLKPPREMGGKYSINVFGFTDSPAKETDGCGQPSCGQEGRQRKVSSFRATE